MNLIPNLSALASIIHEPFEGQAMEPHIVYQLESLPYHVRNTFFALKNFEILRSQAVASVSINLKPGSQLMVSDEISEKIAWMLDSFFSSARRAQNALISYISYCPPRQSLPSSMHDLHRNLANSSVTLPENITTKILQYWADSGLKLKNYRDRLEHTGIISSDPIVFLTEDGSPAVKIMLPSNPEVDSLRAFNFTPGIHASDYIHQGFIELLVFINSIIEELIALLTPGRAYEEARKARVHIIAFRTPIVLGPQPRGTLVPFPRPIEESILEVLNSFQAPLTPQ